jgi:hypothetical protein
VPEVLVISAVGAASSVTIIMPAACAQPQPPVRGMLYKNVPGEVGVPLMIIVLADQLAVTPSGNPIADPMPEAPAVVCAI